MKLTSICFLILSVTKTSSTLAFTIPATPFTAANTKTNTHLLASTKEDDSISRRDWLSTSGAAAAATTTILLTPSEPALARGRATLEQAYDRYVPRIVAGGEFYGKDMRVMIEKSDWAGLKAATAEPPKKTKADKSKADGGVSERAAQAGQFSNSRVLVAADLFAATFSDSSVSPKTKSMQAEVSTVREVVEGIRSAALVALGEEKQGGGFLGLGGKKPNPAELAKRVRELYVKGGNAWNQYIFLANDGLPVQLNKIPYL